jgi:Xaa-Pro aminopeptidase
VLKKIIINEKNYWHNIFFIMLFCLKGFNMIGSASKVHDFSIHISRRKELIENIRREYPQKTGMVMLFAGFENDRYAFRQDSSFYYTTGIREPGVVFVEELDQVSSLYIPNYSIDRKKWLYSFVDLTHDNALLLGLARVCYLGKPCNGYQSYPFFEKENYEVLLQHIEMVISVGGFIFTLAPNKGNEYEQQRIVLNRIAHFIPNFFNYVIDISHIITRMRQSKHMLEIEKLYKAIEITALAQEAAAQSIKSNILECEVQAAIEYIFLGSSGKAAFPSIVASGHNGTILHYVENKDAMKDGDLVIIDIGAEYQFYCADITRTYPVSGKFSVRQKELYNLVLQTQEYIVSLARPGYWLSNKDHPDKSLHHLAKKYLQDRGYGDYFIHGIGHYLGLDVHDVGDYTKPLQEGDVITVEPGVYIPAEKIGIRIEDNYWIVKDGNVCLSEYIPKQLDEIEFLMKEQHNTRLDNIAHEIVKAES